MVIANKIRNLYKSKLMLLEDLSDKIGMSRASLSESLKRDDYKVSTLLKIAEVLDVPIGYFFEEEDTNNNIINEPMTNYKRSNSGELVYANKLIKSLEEQIEGLKRELYLVTKDEAYKQTNAS